MPDDVDRLLADLSNWGRFGADDELGTFNLLTDDRRVAAARLVVSGRSITLARPLRPRAEPDNPEPMLHMMRRSGEAAAPDGFTSAADWIGLGFHGFGTTHLDALCHVMWKGQMYNGVPAGAVTTARRATRLSVEPLRGGALARGVLLDAPRALGVPWLDPGEGLSVDDLERCERAAGVKVSAGDVLLVRTGRDARRSAVGAHDPMTEGFPGLLPSTLPWIRERDVALLGSDAVSDVMLPGRAPHLMPVHIVALVGMGMPLLDNAALDELARACAEGGRWHFMFSMTPLPIQGATGSPVAPIAVF